MDTKTKDAIHETMGILLGLDGLLLALMESPNMTTAFELSALKQLVDNAARKLSEAKAAEEQ